MASTRRERERETNQDEEDFVGAVVVAVGVARAVKMLEC